MGRLINLLLTESDDHTDRHSSAPCGGVGRHSTERKRQSALFCEGGGQDEGT